MAGQTREPQATIARVRRKAKALALRALTAGGRVALFNGSAHVWPATRGDTGAPEAAERFLDRLHAQPEAQAALRFGGAAAVDVMRTEQADESSLARWERDGTSDYDADGNARPVPRVKASRNSVRRR